MTPIIRMATLQRRGSANESDFDGILDLQSRNLYSQLLPTELADGFVTTPFIPELLGQLLIHNGAFVAESEGNILGYLLAAD